MAKGLCIRSDGTVIVEYGKRKIVLPRAQYMANGYAPPLQKLPLELIGASNGVEKRLKQIRLN
jgi:hypothetical protein